MRLNGRWQNRGASGRMLAPEFRRNHRKFPASDANFPVRGFEMLNERAEWYRDLRRFRTRTGNSPVPA